MKIEQLGPYRVVRPLGRGGMGTVFETVHVETGQPAAIKMLSNPVCDDEGLAIVLPTRWKPSAN